MVVLKVILILQVLLNSVSLITQTGNCSNYQKWARNGEKLSSICDALRDLVAFIQFKKREKHPWRSVKFSNVAGFSLQLY